MYYVDDFLSCILYFMRYLKKKIDFFILKREKNVIKLIFIYSRNISIRFKYYIFLVNK